MGVVLAVRCALGRVVGVMTLLAEGGQVVVGVVGRVVVEVGDGEDDLAAGVGVGLVVLGAAPFAAVAGALEAGAARDLGPVGRVEGAEFGADGQGISFMRARRSGWGIAAANGLCGCGRAEVC